MRRQFFAPEIGWTDFGFREKWRRNRQAELAAQNLYGLGQRLNTLVVGKSA